MDMLKVVDIDAKGYGRIYKAVMRHQQLPIISKTIYSYFCAYAGNGTTAFPHRDKILRDLKLNKDTYTKYLNALTDVGLIKKQRTFRGNVYEIVMQPTLFATVTAEPTQDKDILRCTGVKAQGYGTVPKLAMLDGRMTAQAKAIYAYFCSFAGSGTVAFPHKATIIRELGISERTYYTHFALLTELGYVNVSQRKENGRFSVSEYVLNEQVPIQAKSLKNAISNAFGAMSDILQCGGKQNKVVSAPKVISEILQSDKLPSEKFACENFGHANTKNNNTNNTLLLNNSIYNQHPLCGDNGLHLSTTYTKRKVCELIDYNFQLENIQATAQLKSMCKEFKSDKERATFEKKATAMLDELTKQITTLLNLKSSIIFIGHEEVDALELKASLLEKLNKETIMELIQRAVHYSNEIRSIKAYMAASVYNFAVC